ncbi:ATP-dependent DNA helicase [Agrococcus jejuensis]|uniref:ATP-dependent DNA helicase n=1 Tax=Agrococcus jejuensis TaxID=399736 RepID=UPI0011A96520|nr:AAA family ATPase [Agrococcus jejuensis]
MGVSLTAEQQAVFDRIELTRDHLFITGRAGTGKSTLLQHLAWQTSKALAICAPTGVAALNVGGQTIHSLFRLPLGLIGDAAIDQTQETRKLLNSIETLVIDEVSMVNADLMDAIDRSLRQARQRPAEAFGGVQIVMFGDPYQLAPVPGDADERAYVADHYRSMWFFDARVWLEADLDTVELVEIHRQADLDFKVALNAVRHGTVTADIAQLLNEAGARTPPEDDILTLATRNDMVQRTNARELARLKGSVRKALAEVSGDFGPRAKPAEEVLELKVGAQVMFLRNDSQQRWVNGSIGRVVRIAQTVRVEIDGEEHEVEPAVWERYRYQYSPVTKELRRDVVAEFTQFPLRLAWAVTIHKSQGSTFEQAIIDLGSRAFSPGQTYVALSRLTSLDGLYLSRPLRPADIIVDQRVREYISEVRTKAAEAKEAAAAAATPDPAPAKAPAKRRRKAAAS